MNIQKVEKMVWTWKFSSNTTLRVLALFLGLCCILGTYYSLSLLWHVPVKNQSEGRSVRQVYTTKDIIQVMIASEESRLGGAISVINSVISNSRYPVHFYITTDNKSIAHISKWIEGSKLKSISYQIKAFNDDWLYSRIKLSGSKKSLLPYAKIFVSKLFPYMKGRLIYLDDDVIVNGDLSELAAVSIADGHIGAISKDCDALSKRYNTGGNKYFNALNLKSPHLKGISINATSCTFNLGVFVLNMTLWNKENITRQLEHWIELNSQSKDIFKIDGPLPPMLIVLNERISSLHPSWHVRHLGASTGALYSPAYLKKAKILHWDGYFKPWNRLAPYTDLWDKYFIPDPTGKFRPLRKFSRS